MLRAVFVLVFIIVYAAASDTNTTEPSIHINPLSDRKYCIECLNAVKEDPKGTNWFFYRDLLEGMDEVQHYLSHKVKVFSSNLDYSIATPRADTSTDALPLQLAEYQKEHKSKETYRASWSVDAFFKDETYLDAQNRSYVRIRTGYEYNQRGSNSIFQRVSARIRLPRTEDRFQLFIGGETKENSILSEGSTEKDNSDVGVKFFIPTVFKLLNASASAGFSGIDNPYVKGRVDYPLFFKAWLFRPVQQVRYSVQDEFQEWTNFYFDYKTAVDEMLRVLLQRSTQSSVNGMNYMLQLSYFNAGSQGLGLSRYVAVNGRTKDLSDPYADGTYPQEGIYSYALGGIWRQKLGRDYIFYQLQPIVDFHEEYDYKANVIFKATLELYFGNY